MKKRLILDAYNIIHAIPEFEACLQKSLAQAREALIQFCKKYLEIRKDIDHIDIVFDGTEETVDKSVHPQITVHYSNKDEDADNLILKMTEDFHGKESLRVVTHDVFIINNGRALWAKMMSPDEFYNTVEKTPAPKKAPALSPQQKNEITTEYKKFLGLNP